MPSDKVSKRTPHPIGQFVEDEGYWQEHYLWLEGRVRRGYLLKPRFPLDWIPSLKNAGTETRDKCR